MPTDAVKALIHTLGEAQLLDPPQLEELGSFRTLATPRDMVEWLVRRGWLTPFQGEHVLRGRGRKLRLGQYVLLGRLGAGGMGQVFKGRHRVMRRLAALKVIRREWVGHPDAVQRFLREMQTVARLSHPHVIHAYDADRAGSSYFIVMEFAEGSDLKKAVLEGGPLPVAQACECARQAALGLAHAHGHGLVHRDVKPSNLLLASEKGQVKVLDLGLARLQEGAGEEAFTYLTRAGTVLGTLDYISPEQVLSATVDRRADLYSLGCTLYYLLTGRVPFPGGTLQQKLLSHCRLEPEAVERLRPEVPPALAAVVRRLMAKRPDDRYQTAEEVAEALGSALRPGRGGGPRAVPPPLPESAAAPAAAPGESGGAGAGAPAGPRRARLLAAGAVCAVGLAVAALLLAWLSR